MSSVRQRKLNAGRQGGFENVGAVERSELFPTDRQSGFNWQQLVRVAGRHDATWAELIVAFLIEYLGCMVIAAAVSVATRGADAAFGLTQAFYVAVVTAVVRPLAAHWSSSYALRFHGNGIFTLGYFTSGDVGAMGILFYLIAQYAGAASGGAIGGALNAPTNLALRQAAIPMPVVAETSYLGVWMTQLFIAAFLVMSHLIFEYVTDKREDSYEPQQLMKKYHKANKYTALFTFIITFVLFQKQLHMVDTVSYFGALIATGYANGYSYGPGAAGSYGGATSVFGVDGGAVWSIYLFAPLLGALIGGGLFWLVFMLRRGLSDGPSSPLTANYVPPATRKGEAAEAVAPEPANSAMRLEDLVQPFLPHGIKRA